MRIEHPSPDRIEVFVRQSWLNNFRNCPERARFDLHNQSVATDLTMVGTAVHAAAELWLRDQTVTEQQVVATAAAEWNRLVAVETTARWTKYKQPMEGEVEATRLARSWWNNLRQKCDSVVAVEEQFCVPFFETQMLGTDVHVYLEGTIDLVQSHSIWDWKTSSKKYSWRDTQLHNLQSTVYAVAAQRMGWLSFPIEMNFAVMVRGTDDAHVVAVRRDESHVAWLRRQILSALRLQMAVGVHSEWPTNDQSALCTPDWCSAWASCKGAHVAHIPYPTRSK